MNIDEYIRFDDINKQFTIPSGTYSYSDVACAGCFVIWNYSCSILVSVRTNQYVYLNPIATIIFSVIILHEKITPCIVLGTILTLSGLIISEYKKKES